MNKDGFIVAGKLFSRMFYNVRYGIYIKMMEKELHKKYFDEKSFVIRQVTYSDLRKKEPLFNTSVYCIFNQFLKEKNICFAVFVQSRLAGYSCIDFNKAERNQNGYYPLAEMEAYLCNTYIFKHFRKRGLYKAFCMYRMAFCFEKGIRSLRVLVSNPFSLRAIQSLGFFQSGSIHYFYMCGYERITYMNG